MPEIATVVQTRSTDADSRTETNKATANTAYINAVYSPASKPAGLRPHKLIPGAMDRTVEISDRITTDAAATSMKYAGGDNLSTAFCERIHSFPVATLISNLDASTPPRSVPKKRIVVAFDVDVISANDDSGRTMKGTTIMAVNRNTSCAFRSPPSSALIGSDRDFRRLRRRWRGIRVVLRVEDDYRYQPEIA